MAITKSAKKAAKSSLRKRVFNLRRMGVMKSAVKTVKNLVTSKKVEDAKKSLSEAYQAIDKALKRGIIKKNTAARKKSRLVKMIKKASVK
ncbi:MAG: 30S ribosomal protein S20 [bacterium]